MKKITSIAVFFLLAACVSNRELGQNGEHLIAEENPILMTHPDFEGGTQSAERRPLKNVKNYYYARYSTKEPDKGFASLAYLELYGHRYYPRKDAKYYFDGWELEGAKVLSSSEKMSTKMGPADYLLFEVDQEQCAFISKRLNGDKASMQGYFCFNQTVPLSSKEIALIGENLRLRF